MTDHEENSNKMEPNLNRHTEQEENREESKSTASLDNLIFDCLEMIFNLLDLKSLLNVAGTCKSLQSEVISFVNDKFSIKDVTLYHNINHSPYICLAAKQEIKGLKSCLTFFRYFGACVLKLSVQWHTWTPYKTMNPMDIPNCMCHTLLDQYINRYCDGSLSTIRFRDKSEFLCENYVKPFVKVHTVRLFHCGLAQQLPQFINWFPNLRLLDIDETCTHQLSADTEIRFPHLQHLKIFEDDQHRMGVAKLLRMNPQLQSLEIFSRRITMTDLLDMISGNPSILKLSVKSIFFVNADKLETIRFTNEHPLIVELNLYGYEFKVTDAIRLITQLNSLKTIDIAFQTEVDRRRFAQQSTIDWKVMGGRTYYDLKMNRKSPNL